MAGTVFQLVPAEIAALDLPINGIGGHQRFLRRLQQKVDRPSGSIALTDAEIGKVVRYVSGYGGGGFQNRFREAFRRSLRDAID